jgi:hypothetical protein
LNIQKRTHIHFASGEPGRGDVVSGARLNVNVLIYADVPAAMAAGIEFFLSQNNVILTKGIDGVFPPKFFKRVVFLGKRGGPDEELDFDRTCEGVPLSVAVVPVDELSTRPLKRGGGKSGGTPGTCRFRYLMVLDFEATCNNPVQTSPQEIIEFPTVVVDTVEKRVVGEFRRFVRPVIHPELTRFCTELTGIRQVRVCFCPWRAMFAVVSLFRRLSACGSGGCERGRC